MMKLAISMVALAASVLPAVATDLPPLRLQIQPNVIIEDECDDVCYYEDHRISPRIVVEEDRRFAIPGFVRPLNPEAFDWRRIPEATSFDWYNANVLGNVYETNHIGVIGDVNFDGYADQVFLIEIITPRTSFQLISVWMSDPETGSYWTLATKLDRLYEGIELKSGEVWLTQTRPGRVVHELFPLAFD